MEISQPGSCLILLTPSGPCSEVIFFSSNLAAQSSCFGASVFPMTGMACPSPIDFLGDFWTNSSLLVTCLTVPCYNTQHFLLSQAIAVGFSSIGASVNPPFLLEPIPNCLGFLSTVPTVCWSSRRWFHSWGPHFFIEPSSLLLQIRLFVSFKSMLVFEFLGKISTCWWFT